MASSRSQRNSGRELTFQLATIRKIMKKVLPEKTMISTEAKLTVEECLSAFIAFITKRAAKKSKEEERHTIDGDDIIWAMKSLGFNHYVPLLQNYLDTYRNPNDANQPEMTETETETSESGVPLWLLRRLGYGDGDGYGEFPIGILGVGTVQKFQDLPAIILRAYY